jgi:FAD/FMN-containing dehydrogenase
VCAGCLVLDVSAGWGGVAVDAAAATAVVGAGATMAALLNATVPLGLLAPTGSCSSVGVAGFVLGGGIGWTSRLHGLAADALLAATVVLANGTVVVAERARGPHAELLWALGGGGGGNLGVLLDATLALARVPPQLLYFSYTLPWTAALDAVGAYLGLWDEPRFDAYALFVRPSSARQPSVLLQGIWVGDLAAGAAALAPLGALAAASNASGAAAASVTVTDYLTAHALFEGPLGARTANKQKSAFVPRGWQPSVASAGALELIRAALVAAPADVADNSAVYLNSMGGAINAVGPGATPFPHRASLANLVIDTHWTDPGSAPGALAWTRALHAQLAAGGYLGPAGAGGALPTYVNYMDADLGPDPDVWGPAYYGAANFARLQAIKAAYDPTGVFAFAQSVPLPPPAGVGGRGGGLS